ncbi:MAG: Transaldolase [Sodalis sp.]|nr:MAG: Transaldolase [Sodalis sp.]
MNQSEGLKQFTTIVADSGDIESIRYYTPQDATTNSAEVISRCLKTRWPTPASRAVHAKPRLLTPAIN